MAEGNVIEEATCRYCGVTGRIRIEWRERLTGRPLGSFSLSGSQMKISVVSEEWPWAVCDACGHESEGQRDE